jgi:GTP-binding protein Era
VSAPVPYRAGYAALVGRPNVGKSSLLNVFVGAHLGAVSAKPHTTRQRLLGVRTFEHAQIAFVDTPGIQRRRPTAVHKAMDRAVDQAVATVDLVALVVEAGVWKQSDSGALEHARETGLPIALIINKIDLVKDKTQLLPYIEGQQAPRFRRHPAGRGAPRAGYRGGVQAPGGVDAETRTDLRSGDLDRP